MIQITMADLERLVCRMTRYKQESAKYRKIVAMVLILLAVLAAVWLAEGWYTRHKTSAAAAGANPIGQLLTGQPDPAEPYTGTISLVVAGHYATEFPIVPVVADKLKQRFAGVRVLCSRRNKDPFSYL